MSNPMIEQGRARGARRLRLAGPIALMAGAAACAPHEPSADGRAGSARQAVTSVTLDPNEIHGTLSFTNQNPAVLTVIEGLAGTSAVSALSESPAGFSASTGWVASADRLHLDYDISAEAGANGDAGVTYSVSAVLDWYNFLSTPTVVLQPKALQPNGVTLDFAECVGLLRVRFGTDATCQTPAAVSSAAITPNNNEWSTAWNGSTLYVLLGDGQTIQRTLSYSVGQDVGYIPGVLQGDLINFTTPVSATGQCDQIQDLCIPLSGGSGGGLGAFTGPFQVAGETLDLNTHVFAWNGPNGNQRWETVTPPLMPATDPSTWWLLPNLPAGDYSLAASGFVRLGRSFNPFTTTYAASYTPVGTVTAVAGTASSLVRTANGASQYPFDMHPGYIEGKVVLADPFVAANQASGAFSSFQDLLFEADYDANHDGIPDYPYLNSNRSSTVVYADATGNNYDGASVSAFPGSFDPAAGALSSSYQLVLPLVYDVPQRWWGTGLSLWMQSFSRNVPLPVKSSDPGFDPERFRYGELDFIPNGPTSTWNTGPLIGPGQHYVVDHEYCTSELEILYDTTSGTFYNPYASLYQSGGFTGTDWQGKAASYAVSGGFWGSPACIGCTPAEGVAVAQASGKVWLPIPQGTYTITPGASAVSPGGSVSSATFPKIDITVGCGQRITASPGLAVSLTQLPACAPSRTITVSGQVQSGAEDVDHVYYRLNGGPPIDICTNCGPNPSYQVAVSLAVCSNTIEVFATSPGISGVASSGQQTTWDDPTDGVVCGDGSCSHDVTNRPPVALCHDVTVDAGGASCQAAASIDAGSYDPDANDTVTCTQAPSGSFGLGAHQVTLTCTDSHGAAASCSATVTVADVTPPLVTLGATPSLWPADHKYQAFSLSACVAAVTDACSGSLSVDGAGHILRIVSDEPEDAPGEGDGHTCGDMVITSDTTALLRAERDGGGNGRVYTVYFTVHDGSGNVAESSCEVQVKHDVASAGAVDSGPAFCVGTGCGSIPGPSSSCR